MHRRKPIPLGPWNLWAEAVRKINAQFFWVNRDFADCFELHQHDTQQGVACNCPISAMGSRFPVSLLANMVKPRLYLYVRPLEFAGP